MESKWSVKMVFCYQNYSNLLWENIVASDREKLLKFEAERLDFAKVRTIFGYRMLF